MINEFFLLCVGVGATAFVGTIAFVWLIDIWGWYK
jgi:hypothetical protein